MSLSCSKKSLSEYRQLSPPFKALRDLTRAFSVSLSNHFPTKERGWDFLRIHEHIPGFRLWSDYILFRKCPDNHTQHLQLTKKVWNSQVPMHSHVPETFMSLLMAKHFPQWPFPILSPLSGTIKLVRSHLVPLIAFTYFISLSLIPGTSFVIYLLVHQFSLQLNHPAFLTGLQHPVLFFFSGLQFLHFVPLGIFKNFLGCSSRHLTDANFILPSISGYLRVDRFPGFCIKTIVPQTKNSSIVFCIYFLFVE